MYLITVIAYMAIGVLGAHVRALPPINICHFNAKLCTINDVYFCKGIMFFDVHVEMTFVLTPIV